MFIVEEEIIYTFNPEHFKELIYTAKSSPIRKPFVFLIVSIIVVVTIYIISLRFPALSFVIVIAAMLVVGCTIFLLTEISEHHKLKKQVADYIGYMKDKKLVVSVKNDFIKLETDKETVIESFKNLKSVVIKDDCITLRGESGINYYFIAKSMGQKSFKQLKTVIETNMI